MNDKEISLEKAVVIVGEPHFPSLNPITALIKGCVMLPFIPVIIGPQGDSFKR